MNEMPSELKEKRDAFALEHKQGMASGFINNQNLVAFHKFIAGFDKCFELMSKDIESRINAYNKLDEINIVLNEKLALAIKTLELIAQDQFNGRDGEPDPMKVILRMRVEALNTLEKLK